MLNSETFLEVLIDTLTEGNNAQLRNINFNAGWESTLEPHGLAQILAQTNIHEPSPFRAKKAYGLKVRPKARNPQHSFNETQAEAFKVLLSWSSQLPNDFCKNELKLAYRQAVLKTHPDCGGKGETFQEVKKSYHILEALVKNEA